MRRLAIIVMIAAVAPALVSTRAARASVLVLTIDGKGWGHGVGMAQDGAYWMGRDGASSQKILGHFYAGTALGRAGGSVRVAVLNSPSNDALVAFPDGGEVRDARSGPQSPGFPVRVGPGGQVHLWFDGRYHAQPVGGAPASSAASRSATVRPAPPAQVTDSTLPPLPTSTTEPPPPPPPTPTTAPPSSTTTTAPSQSPSTTTTAPPGNGSPPPPTPPPTAPETASSRTLWTEPANGSTTVVVNRGRRYRGEIEAIAGGGLRLVDEVDVEQYLRGMGEVLDPSWPPAALQTQAIAARTYALRAMAVGGEICDDDRCQVYLGQQVEYGAMDKAIYVTRGQVVRYQRDLASTVYSANGGGFSATGEEGFGSGADGRPYWQAVPYTTKDPDPWTVRIALTDLAARFGYAGTLTGAHVSRAGPSGRALEMTLDGSAGPQVVEGHRFYAGLGLKSTLFTVRVEEADAAPPPPAPADLIQVPPEEAADAVAADAANPEVVPRLPPGRVLGVGPRVHLSGGWVMWFTLALSLAALAIVARLDGSVPTLPHRLRLRRRVP